MHLHVVMDVAIYIARNYTLQMISWNNARALLNQGQRYYIVLYLYRFCICIEGGWRNISS